MKPFLHCWADRLEALCATLPPLHRVRVMAEIDTTQDLAVIRASAADDRSAAGGAGSRGTAGPMRASPDWPSASACLPPASRSGRWCCRALAESLGALLPDRIEVKPPNDLLVDGRKLAGVLIEQSVGAAVIGIGINVGPIEWDEELEGRAISLAEAGVQCDRLEVLELVLPAVVHAWTGA